MNKLYVTAAVATFGFLAGFNLIMEKRSFAMLGLGFVLVAVTGPYLYYTFHRIRHGYKGSREADALEQAQQELDIQRKLDGKK